MKIYCFSADVDFPPMENDNHLRIVSVFIRDNTSTIHNWRCPECGRIAFQYSGDVVQIYDGAIIPKEKSVLDVLCHLCKIKFRVTNVV